MTNEPVIIERTFDAPIDKVWKALTNKNLMKEWYFNLAEFKPVAGFEFSFEGGPLGKSYIHLCRITKVESFKTLAYTWKYKDYEGESLVTFELFAGGNNKTRLKLTHEGLETFPQNNPDLAKHNFVEGWTDAIGRSLKEFLEKTNQIQRA